MIDDRIFPPPAAVSEIDSVVNVPAPETYPRKHTAIPNHAVEYLKKWDDYRAEKQAMYAALDEKVKTVLLADGTFIEVFAGEKLDYFRSCISEFPTPENLAASPDLDEIERAAKRGYEIAQRKEKSLWRKLKRLVGR